MLRAGSIHLTLVVGSLLLRQGAAQVRTVDTERPEITYPAVDLSRPVGLRLGSAPSVTITETSGCVFNRVRAIVIQQQGSLVAANSGNDELCVFDRRGRLIQRKGRRGEGPGEYQAIFGLMALPGDSLLVFDGRLRRLSVLDAEGEFVRSILLKPPDDKLGSVARVAVAGDGSILVGYSEFIRGQPSPTAVQITMQLFRYDSEGKLRDRLGRFLLSEHFIQQAPQNMGGVAYWDRAFGRQMWLAPVGRGFLAGDGADFRIRQYAADGAVDLVHRFDQAVRAVSQADIAAYKRLQLHDLQGDRLRLVERLVSEMPYPSTYPTFGALLSDSAGRIWMRSYPQPGEKAEHWIVLDPSTRQSSLLLTPRGFQIQAVSAEQACGVTRDVLDVESVQCFPVLLG